MPTKKTTKKTPKSKPAKANGKTNGKAEAKTKTTKRRGRPPKARQQSLPGMELKRDEQLTRLGEDLYETQMARIDLQKDEQGKREQLLFMMRERKLEVYEDPELELRISLKLGKDKISVKKLSNVSEEEAAEAV